MHLIGITGRARAGKDTVAKHLVRQHGFVTSSFAGPLKRAAVEMFGLTPNEQKEEVKEDVIPFWGISPRTMYQKLGTEGGRQVFGDTLWLKRWQKFYNEFGASANICVSDVRFENEATMVRNLGGIVVHVRNPRGNLLDANAKAHASEAGVASKRQDWLLNNDSDFANLYSAIDRLVDFLDSGRFGRSDA